MDITMAHYALLDDNNLVTAVYTGIDETELIEGTDPETWYGQFHGARCVRCSYNNRIRGHYPSIGDRYDDILDLFIAPQPFPSWTMTNDGWWKPPFPPPNEEQPWAWDETNQTWVPFE